MIAFYGIPLISAAVSWLFLAGIYRVNRRWLRPASTAISAWWFLTGALAASGILARFDLKPPPMVLMFASVMILGVVLGRSKVGTAFRDGVPIGAMLAAQGFRIPLELVMNQAAVDGIMPVQMSFRGYNFEIFSATFALVVGLMALKGRASNGLLWAANILAFGTLMGIAVIAVIASPMVHAFGTDPRVVNTWVTHVPYVWLPAICVLAALASHVVITRQLLRKA